MQYITIFVKKIIITNAIQTTLFSSKNLTVYQIVVSDYLNFQEIFV